MVTICTASLTFNNSTFCPHSVFMCFVWISEQTAIISPHSIKSVVSRKRSHLTSCSNKIQTSQYLEQASTFNMLMPGCKKLKLQVWSQQICVSIILLMIIISVYMSHRSHLHVPQPPWKLGLEITDTLTYSMVQSPS